MEDRRILSSEQEAADLERHVAMIAPEFREGFETVDKIEAPAVTIFGSARVREGDRVYEQARTVGRLLAERGWAGTRLEVGGDDASLAAFLEGGALAAPGVPDGQALVTWRGFALGWADCRRGSARSLLPRGLRRKTRAAHALG